MSRAASPTRATKSPADFLRELQERDTTVALWCREHGFSQQLAYRVLNGKTLGRWGAARAIVAAMGLTPADMPARSTPRPKAAAQTDPASTSFLWRRSAPQVVTLKPRYRLHIDGRVELVSAGAQA